LDSNTLISFIGSKVYFQFDFYFIKIKK
jgi:hypothetical protein